MVAFIKSLTVCKSGTIVAPQIRASMKDFLAFDTSSELLPIIYADFTALSFSLRTIAIGRTISIICYAVSVF